MASRQRRGAVSHASRIRRVVWHPAHLRRGHVAVAERNKRHVAVGWQQAGLERKRRSPRIHLRSAQGREGPARRGVERRSPPNYGSRDHEPRCGFHQAQRERDQAVLCVRCSRWSTFRRCQILSSWAKRATATGPTVWPRWTTALDKFWTRSRKQASRRTRLSSLPATTVQRRPIRGRVTADHGAVRISRRWKPHYVRRSLSDGPVRFQRVLSATRSFTL